MWDFFENLYDNWLVRKAENSLIDFASLNLEKLSVEEMVKIQEVLTIIRRFDQ